MKRYRCDETVWNDDRMCSCFRRSHSVCPPYSLVEIKCRSFSDSLLAVKKHKCLSYNTFLGHKNGWKFHSCKRMTGIDRSVFSSQSGKPHNVEDGRTFSAMGIHSRIYEWSWNEIHCIGFRHKKRSSAMKVYLIFLRGCMELSVACSVESVAFFAAPPTPSSGPHIRIDKHLGAQRSAPV